MSSTSLLEDLASTATNFAIAALMLSLLTAIFMQALYEIGLRAYVQRHWVRDWLAQRLMLIGDWGFYEYSKRHQTFLERIVNLLFKWLRVRTKRPEYYDALKRTESLLTYLEGKGREGNIYSLNYQQLCGQFASAIQNELDDPQEPMLIQLFALGVDQEDIEKLHFKKPKSEYFESQKSKRTTSSKANVAQLHERILAFAERGVDDLQIYLGRSWRKNNYLLNLLVSISLTLFLSFLSTQFKLRFTELTWVFLSVGVAGGLFAPIASNILERVFYPR